MERTGRRGRGGGEGEVVLGVCACVWGLYGYRVCSYCWCWVGLGAVRLILDAALFSTGRRPKGRKKGKGKRKKRPPTTTSTTTTQLL